ncbi:MAG: glycosyltransferase family 2 protein [Candidatus Methylacidiphilales bacterium]|nr:glycosyltransferase family 2 protein [Candidatus Methylacidiphilales bacterium]
MTPEDVQRTVSVVMPVFNEESTLSRVVEAVLVRPEVAELILVDDCSRDGTWRVMEKLAEGDRRIRIFRHEVNRGKGAALRSGFGHATAPYVLIQDADLEYTPEDYPTLLRPLWDDRADVVFGSRFMGSGTHRVLYFWHYVGNTFLTLLSNMFTNLNLTDMETCYKVFKREIIQGMKIEEERFGFEPEITAKVARHQPRLRIYEVPISYYGRTYEEGKKIGWKDGVRALWCIVRYNLFR